MISLIYEITKWGANPNPGELKKKLLKLDKRGKAIEMEEEKAFTPSNSQQNYSLKKSVERMHSIFENSLVPFLLSNPKEGSI